LTLLRVFGILRLRKYAKNQQLNKEKEMPMVKVGPKFQPLPLPKESKRFW